MTRWARPGQSNVAARNRKVCEATPWEELHKTPAKRGAPRAERAPPKKKKAAYVNEDVNGFKAEQDRKEQRGEDRRLKRQQSKRNNMVCFHCRKPGHGMADCSEALRCQESGTGICFRCGSTEHEVNKCRAKVDPALGEFPYAKCFICGEMGHLSRSCPDNPKGLYAEGGGCRICGSVEHFQKDCPEHQTSAQMTVSRWSSGMSADHEDVPVQKKVKKVPTKVPKVVKF
ncbi:zinc finger CCHC domain-containing protein 9 [Bufo gargarizans]|uniref:zinc finger CCHC domain-containing protein 9 n=1 Tax=Bufo gargarizans TaxID=30331 RepID=UPI001CF50A8E|nr:zinc finger CCHC domain-containing protein 9 [Bufo gargarizans]